MRTITQNATNRIGKNCTRAVLDEYTHSIVVSRLQSLREVDRVDRLPRDSLCRRFPSRYVRTIPRVRVEAHSGHTRSVAQVNVVPTLLERRERITVNDHV